MAAIGLLVAAAGAMKLMADRKRSKKKTRRVAQVAPIVARQPPLHRVAPPMTPPASFLPRVALDQSYIGADYTDSLPTLQSIYGPDDTAPQMAHPGVVYGHRIPYRARPGAHLFKHQYNSFTPNEVAERQNPGRIPATGTPERQHMGLQQRGPVAVAPSNYFDNAFGDPANVDPYDANSLRYEDGITPSFGSTTGKVLRRETLEPHLHKPAKREVLQNVMRLIPQPQRNVFGDPSMYTEEHERVLEQTKFTQGSGALDTFMPFEGSQTGQQVGFSSGQFITERYGGLHPRKRFYPSTEYKKGVQMYGRLGNPSEAIGKLGSEWSEGVGPLGAYRMPANAHVSEYEREPMPTDAPGRNPVGARIGSVILKPTYRSETNKPYMGQVNNEERAQEAYRLKGRYVKGKNSITREEVGFVGDDNLDRGTYQNVEFDLYPTNRMSTSVDSVNVAQPHFEKAGAYSTSEVVLYPTKRTTTSVPSEHVQRPEFEKAGAYTNVEFDLSATNRMSTSVGSENVAQPHFEKAGAYSTSWVELLGQNRDTTSVGSENVAQPHFEKAGAYSTSWVELLGQNRDTTSVGSENVARPEFAKDAAYQNVEFDLSATNRMSTSVGSEHGSRPTDDNRGTNSAYDAVYLDRGGDQKWTNIYSRPANPILGHDNSADWRMNERINPQRLRYTQKDDSTAILQSPIRPPNSDRTGAMQYLLDFPAAETRRVSPTIVNRIDSDLLTPYKSNPYTQPLTAP